MGHSPPSDVIAFRVTVLAADEDLAVALLYEAGTTGIEVQAAAGGSVGLLAYFVAGPSARGLAQVFTSLPSARVEAAAVPDVDWVARFRERFRAFDAGRFRITPEWDRPVGGGDVIVMDPGRAFGTGSHETTRLCLGALETLAGERPLGRVLDVGTGTGILAVAACRLGASSAVAADLDPEAVDSARRHARLNGADYGVVRADGGGPFRRGAFDVVLANLSAPLLRARAPELLALGAPGSALVLSGLLVEDADDMASAYAGAGPLERRTDGEWACLIGRRPRGLA
jgi:ribosomal protein L11 methyltransferase